MIDPQDEVVRPILFRVNTPIVRGHAEDGQGAVKFKLGEVYNGTLVAAPDGFRYVYVRVNGRPDYIAEHFIEELSALEILARESE